MRFISCKLEDLRRMVLPIGYEGENDHTRVQVDAGEVFKEYPAAVPSLKVHGPGGTIYPAEVIRDGKNVIWDIKASDCASDGSGEAQFTFTLNNVIVKSCIAKIKVYRSIVGGSTPPDPVQDWIDDAEEVLDDLAAMDNIAKTAEAGDVGKALSPKTVVDGVVTEWQYVEPGAGTEDYTDLENKPQIGGVTLSGDKSLHDLGIAAESAIPDVSGKANLSVVAPAFVQETANDAGSLVTYTDGVVYVLPEGHTAGTTWANTQKTATNIAEQQRLLLTAIQGKYTKPSGGIPASDIADGVIPVVDSALSDSSENAVQNKVVKGALDTKAPVIINTVIGNPAVFNDGYGMPIKSLLITFTPHQSGTGDPSPENIRPFLLWDGLSVYQSGVDTSNPTETDIVFPSPVYGGMLDVVSGVMTVKWAVIALNGTEAYWENYNQGTAFCVPIIGMTRDIHKTVFCDRFAQIKNITQFGVYASASNDYVYFINATDIEGVTDLASWKAYLAENPMGFAYELAEPYTVQLTPTQITALVGNNTIWSDADVQLTIEYPADTETFIANQHHNFIAPELSSMIADTALVKNDFRIVGNNLYKITTAIASGGTLTPNTNCVKTTLAEVVKPLLT